MTIKDNTIILNSIYVKNFLIFRRIKDPIIQSISSFLISFIIFFIYLYIFFEILITWESFLFLYYLESV